MKKIPQALIFFSLILNISLASPAQSLERQNRSSRDSVLKSLTINRSMLARFEAQYAELSRESLDSTSGFSKKELTDLKYKIKALDEENQKLTKALPETMQASEFLKDMLAKSESRERSERSLSGLKNDSAAINPAAKVVKRTNPETYQFHERALECVAKKDLRKAITLYEEIVLSDANDDEAYLIMGHCLVLTGDYERAERAFQSAVQISPDNVRQIAPFYENLVMQNPYDPNAYANLGFVYLMFGNLNRANEAFNKALALNPDNANALRGMQIIASQPH